MRQTGLVKVGKIPRPQSKCESVDVSAIPGSQGAVTLSPFRRQPHDIFQLLMRTDCCLIYFRGVEGPLLLTKARALGKFRKMSFRFTLGYSLYKNLSAEILKSINIPK